MATAATERQSPLAFALPHTVRHSASALAEWLKPSRIVTSLRAARRRRQERSWLYRYSDLELADIRLQRSEISEIHTPDFAQRRRT